MDIESKEKVALESMSDPVLFEEVARRLKRQYRHQHGMEFQYGCFEFIFHEGRFQGVEDRPRYRRYKSPGRLTPVPS